MPCHLSVTWFTFTIKLHLKSFFLWWFWNILVHNSILTSTAGTWRTHSCQVCSMNNYFSFNFAITDSVLSHILTPHKWKVHKWFLAQKIVSSTMYIYYIQFVLNWRRVMFYARILCSMHADCTFKNKGLYRKTTVHTNNLKLTQGIQILNKADLTATHTPFNQNDKTTQITYRQWLWITLCDMRKWKFTDKINGNWWHSSQTMVSPPTRCIL